jgi:hypothetical protein
MRRALLWTTAIGVCGLLALAWLGGLRFERQVRREAHALWAAASPPPPTDLASVATLPAPVRAYLEKALCNRDFTVATLRMRHSGRFRPTLDSAWRPIRGEQYYTADLPGFVWWGRVPLAPVLWVDARDRSVAGSGSMLVKLESTLTLADRSGPELDQGALLRLLSELVLLPTAFLDRRYVDWSEVDATQARVTLRVNGHEVTGTMSFGDDALPRAFSARRYFDSGKEPPVLRPWSGEYGDYRAIAGMWVPHRLVGYWDVEGQRLAYVDFRMDALEYDVPPY